MKRIVVALALIGGLAAGANCGSGTLGTPGAGGTTGSGMLQGIGAGPGPVGIAGAGASGDPGTAGDGAPGGASGPAGVGGVAGTGGSTGRGGTGFSCPPVAPVCGALCGNGSLDTCTVPGCPVGPQLEECDGDRFESGGDTCAKRGYGSGKLACTNACTVDEVGCSDCMPIGGAILSCGPAPIVFPYLANFGIAATDTEVGIAQVDVNENTGYSRLTFARLDAKLSLLGAAALEDTGQAGPLQATSLVALGVATTSAGWVVAGCTSSEQLFVDAVDANGKKVLRTILSDFNSPFACASAMTMVQRSGGGALLLWMTPYGGAAAAVVSADGLSAVKPWTLVDPQVNAFAVTPASGAWVGDAFLVAQPVQVNMTTGYYDVVRLFRVAPDGKTTVVRDILRNEISGMPSIVAAATDLRLVYPGVPLGGRPMYDIAMLWRRIGSMGEVLSDPVSLDLFPTYYGRNPAQAFGDDTVILSSASGQEELALVRLDANGKTVGAAYDLARSPAYGVLMYDMARRGSELVVGWIPQQGKPLMLARVTP